MKLFISLFFLILLTGCNTSAISQSMESKIYHDFIAKNKLESLKKITSFHLQNFISLDNRHLIISTTPNKNYLISLMNYCTDLKYADHLGLKQSIASILNIKLDAIIVPGVQNGRCFIKSIHKLNNQQVNNLTHLVKKSP